MKNLKGTWSVKIRVAIVGLLLISLSGCGWLRKESVVVLPDSHQLYDHPSDPGKICMDRGYLLEIAEELEDISLRSD